MVSQVSDPGIRSRNRVGVVIGLSTGLALLILYALSELTDNRTLNTVPRFEAIGLAVGLLPTSAWAGYSISKVIGGPSRKFAFTVLRASLLVGALSVLSTDIGSNLGIKHVGLPIAGGVFDEIRFFFLFAPFGVLIALIVGFVLSSPFHIWSKLRHRAPAP